MDLGTFILAERVTGTVSPVDTNPIEPPRPGVRHYLATMHRDGRSFTSHFSAPIGEAPGIEDALRAAAERARQVETAPHDDTQRATEMRDIDSPAVAPRQAGEIELWRRAQQTEAQALCAFLGDGGYHRLIGALPPRPRGEDRAGRRSRSTRRWLLRALSGTAVVAAPALLVRSTTCARRKRSMLRRLLRT